MSVRGTAAALAVSAVGYVAARRMAARYSRHFEDLEPTHSRPIGESFFVRGRRIHLRIEGSGPPLLLLHGLNASHLTFRRLAPLLASRYTLLMPDLPGFGDSDRDLPDLSYPAQAALLLDLIDRLDLERTAVLGHSIGAAIALRIAVATPERVAALVLAGGPGAHDMLVPPFLHPLVPLVTPLISQTRGGVRWATRAAMARGAVADEALVDACLRAARFPGHAAALTRLLTTGHGPRLDLRAVQQPVLVLAGAADGYLPPGRARTLAARLPRGEAALIRGAGHLMLEEQPRASATAIDRFLGKLVAHKAGGGPGDRSSEAAR